MVLESSPSSSETRLKGSISISLATFLLEIYLLAVFPLATFLGERSKEDPIVVSSFPIDSHDCQRVALKDGGVINEGTIFPVRRENPKLGYPYHIPYRAILPKPEECFNLLVPVALSCTHVGISSIRVEPTWMILGQSAGIAAALAANKAKSVQDLPYPQLRERLLAQGQVLELPVLKTEPPTPKKTGVVVPKDLPGIVLDDAAAELKGAWKHSSNFTPYVGRATKVPVVITSDSNKKNGSSWIKPSHRPQASNAE